MHRPFGVEAGTTLLPGAQVSRPGFNDERLIALMRVSSLFCQPESIDIDFARALVLPPLQAPRLKKIFGLASLASFSPFPIDKGRG